MTFPNGTHLVEVEIDPETGAVRLVRYAAFDDYGEHIDDAIVAGQVHGAIAQGVGQAMLEEAVFEPETGQPLTGFLHGLCHAARRRPAALRCRVHTHPMHDEPLGVKGCGEAGAIAGYPAVTNAILDALAPLGVQNFNGAASPFRIWRAIRRRRRNNTNDHRLEPMPITADKPLSAGAEAAPHPASPASATACTHLD